MLKLKLVTPAATPLVTLEEAKSHMRVEDSVDDTLIGAMVERATRWCEEEAELSFMQQTWRLSLDRFPCGEPIQLRRPPVTGVTSVEYYDADGTLQTLDAEAYQVDTDAEPALVAPAPGETWPETECGRLGAVRVTYVAGAADAANADPRAKQAVLALAAAWHENREAWVTGTIATDLEGALRALLQQMWVGLL